MSGCKFFGFSLLSTFLFFCGCSGSGEETNAISSSEISQEAVAPTTQSASAGRESGLMGDAAAKSSQTSAETAKALGREIIRNASVRLSVDDFDTFPERLAQAAVEAGGFIADADIARLQGSRRSGRWVIRVPSEEYSPFIHAVSSMGVAESVQEKADDVTEKFVDLQARIKGGKQLEEQLTKLLERQNEKLENVLTLEREIARVRTEIEQKEGMLRFLQNQVTLSTIVLQASEREAYTPELARTFSERISIEWASSLKRSKESLENFAVWFVAHVFELAVWAVSLLLFWMVIGRRFWKFLRAPWQPAGV